MGGFIVCDEFRFIFCFQNSFDFDFWQFYCNVSLSPLWDKSVWRFVQQFYRSPLYLGPVTRILLCSFDGVMFTWFFLSCSFLLMSVHLMRQSPLPNFTDWFLWTKDLYLQMDLRHQLGGIWQSGSKEQAAVVSVQLYQHQTRLQASLEATAGYVYSKDKSC